MEQKPKLQIHLNEHMPSFVSREFSVNILDCVLPPYERRDL